jgi:GR25 family glycosyltransferase involved in LPS biosynthesis
MNIGKYTFYSGRDSYGYDIVCFGKKPVDELMLLCERNNKIIGFNTYGYCKYFVCDQKDHITLPNATGKQEGIYVHTERYNEMKSKIYNKMRLEFEDYEFCSNKESRDGDISYLPDKSLIELKQLCDKNPKCVGFDTLGYLKATIKSVDKMEEIKFSPYDGTYIKKDSCRIKLMCNWTTSKGLCNEWNNMTKGNYRWNDIVVTWEDKNVDYYVIINKPYNNEEYYDPKRTIIFQMEPQCGVSTWGQWANPDNNKFLQVRTSKDYPTIAYWQLDLSYDALKKMSFVKTKSLAIICSAKYVDPGHIKRIDFLKYIEKRNDEFVKIDIFGSTNQHGFKNSQVLPNNSKNHALIPYKYYFMCENNSESNYITEKIWEPILCESLCFYWGCPNIAEYIDNRAFIQLDMDNFEKAFDTIKNAILNNEWEKRIDIIRREKQKILEHYMFFPTLERIIKKELKLPNHPSDEDLIKYELDSNTRIKCVNLERRKDRKKYMTDLLTDNKLYKYCDFIQAVDGAKLDMNQELQQIFAGNDFGSRRGFIGCALSHMNLWKDLSVDSKYNKYIVIEDDIEMNGNMLLQFNNTDKMLEKYPDWDILYFGCTIRKQNMQKYQDNVKKGNNIIVYDTSLSIGGTFGYIINKNGANKLLKFIENNGVKHGIDYIMTFCQDRIGLKSYEVLPHIIFSEYADGTPNTDSDIQYDFASVVEKSKN